MDTWLTWHTKKEEIKKETVVRIGRLYKQALAEYVRVVLMDSADTGNGSGEAKEEKDVLIQKEKEDFNGVYSATFLTLTSLGMSGKDAWKLMQGWEQEMGVSVTLMGDGEDSPNGGKAIPDGGEKAREKVTDNAGACGCLVLLVVLLVILAFLM